MKPAASLRMAQGVAARRQAGRGGAAFAPFTPGRTLPAGRTDAVGILRPLFPALGAPMAAVTDQSAPGAPGGQRVLAHNPFQMFIKGPTRLRAGRFQSKYRPIPGSAE